MEFGYIAFRKRMNEYIDMVEALVYGGDVFLVSR